MVPFVPTVSTPRAAPAGPPVSPSPRDLTQRLRDVERHPDFLRTSMHEPSQLVAWASVIAGAFPWIVLPFAATLLQLVNRRPGEDDRLLIVGFALAFAFGVFRIVKHAAAPLERESAIVVEAVEKTRRGRRRKFGGRRRHSTCKVRIESAAGMHELVTDVVVFHKARRGSAGIAWRRGRFLLDWLPVDA